MIGGLPIRTTRNYFGSQIASFETSLRIQPLSEPFPAIFIRAPVVEEIYLDASDENTDKVEVLSTLQVISGSEEMELIVAIRQGPVFGTSFHPELTQDNRLHEWWIRNIVIPEWQNR